MNPVDRVVNSGGGAVFQGNVTAGRDITINHIIEIRQVTERLSSHRSEADTSDKLLGSLEALSGAAEFIEDYAKELNASVCSSSPLLERVSRECASILKELKELEHVLGHDGDGGYVFTASLNENVVDLRSRLMSLQMYLSSIHGRKTAKDFGFIKEAVTQLTNSHQSSDDASTIRSFYTASSIPYVERQMWQGIEKALRARFTTDFVRDNYALIVTSVEELLFENTSPWIVEGPKPDDLPSELLNTTIDGTTLRVSEHSNTTTSHMKGARMGLGDEVSEMKEDVEECASLRPVHSGITLVADRSGVEWSRSVNDGTGECLLTLDGGGVESYSSILIIEQLMTEIIACENRFERDFTHYPRTFNASDFRPCHYFHKMYGTSTGGILAIALSRLRMTVAETIVALKPILKAMYANAGNVVPLATKYSHSNFEAALISMVQKYCKQHERGLCGHEEKFQWCSTGINTREDCGDGDDSSERQDLHASKRRAFKPHAPEYHLCQTICSTTVNFGKMDKVHLLRTYNHRYNWDIVPKWVLPYNEGTPDFYTWQVGRATTAAPFFSKPREVIGSEHSSLSKDGGPPENNPSYCAYSEASSLWGGTEEPTLLLSIGACRTSSTSDSTFRSRSTPFSLSTSSKYAKKKPVLKNAAIKYTRGQDQHKLMRVIAGGGHTWYKRFEVTHGLEKIGAGQRKRGNLSLVPGEDATLYPGGETLSTIRTATEVYLNRQEADRSASEYAAPRQMLKQTAEKLVRMRRARELDAMTQVGEKQEQWEAFMGKSLTGEREFFRKYQEEWDYALLGRKK